jgi:hypothetical protein
MPIPACSCAYRPAESKQVKARIRKNEDFQNTDTPDYLNDYFKSETHKRPKKSGGDGENQILRTTDESAKERGKGGVCGKAPRRTSLNPRGNGAGS